MWAVLKKTAVLFLALLLMVPMGRAGLFTELMTGGMARVCAVYEPGQRMRETPGSGILSAVPGEPETPAWDYSCELSPAPEKTDYWGRARTEGCFFYRELLPEDQRACYDAVFQAVSEGRSEAWMPRRVLWGDFGDIIDAFFNDNPQFYHADPYKYHYCVDDDGFVARVDVVYDAFLSATLRGFYASTGAILEQAVRLRSDVEREKFIHDALCQSARYMKSEYDQYAYSAVTMGLSVCGGYAAAFQYYMDMLAIPCYFACNDVHTWNAVELDGEFYAVDVMWDDGDEEGIYYDFFNVPDSRMVFMEQYVFGEDGTTHTRTGLSALLPDAKSMEYSYFELVGGGYWHFTDREGNEYTLPDISARYEWVDPFRSGWTMGDWDFDWRSCMWKVYDSPSEKFYFYDLDSDTYFVSISGDAPEYRFDSSDGRWKRLTESF